MSKEVKLVDYQWQPPRNETKEHYLLKQVARVYLVEKGCYYVGTELYIDGWGNNEYSTKRYIDCVGVDRKQITSYGIEVKVSKSDFKNGYCARCQYTYIMCPKDMITPDDLPSYVGLIYVDIDKVRFIPNAKEHRLQGVELIKKASYNINDGYWEHVDGKKTEYFYEDAMFADTQRLVEHIARSNLNELIYNTNRVPMAKIVKGKRRWK